MNNGCQSMIGKLDSVLIKHTKDAFLSQDYLNENWKACNYISCPDLEKALEEYKEFERILKQHVPEINYLPRNAIVGLDSIYTHDPVKITKKGAIILNMGKETRKSETLVMREYLASLNIPILGSISGDGIVEGGDLLWLDEKTLVVGRGYRTNDEGIEQLKSIMTGLVDEFIVAQLPHGDGPGECLHLMSIVSLIDEDLAVVYSKLMPVPFREILIERGIELLEVPEKEFINLGCNVLTLEPRKCMMVSGNLITKELLEEKGVKVFVYMGEEISIKGTGGPTCLTCPIVRK
ncbi:MAG: dimethylarginine dimethylaminohydrolase family protein [Candidatus Hodarchaeales archaeon]